MHIWIVVTDTKDGKQIHHFWSEIARDTFLLDLLSESWSVPGHGIMPDTWKGAWEAMDHELADRDSFVHDVIEVPATLLALTSAPNVNSDVKVEMSPSNELAAENMWSALQTQYYDCEQRPDKLIEYCLCDLRHLSDREGLSFEERVKAGLDCYSDEKRKGMI